MNKLQLNEKVIIRSPRFPYNIELKDCWEELKELILESSPEFYKRICDLSYEQLQRADQRLRNTVSKYLNRSKFRSTPYGSFATVTVADLNYKPVPLQFGQSITSHKFRSWRNKDAAIKITYKECIKGNLKFFTNTTYYRVADEIRFIKKDGSTFQIAVIDYDSDIEQILQYCCKQQTFAEIKAGFIELEEQELLMLLIDLVTVQLLLTSKHRNIIGEDHFHRIKSPLNKNDPAYIIAERPIISEGLNAKVFKHLPDLALKMQQINSSSKNDLLDRFIADFNKKYEGMEIPLMIALDPEIGIGYGNFANRDTDSLMEKVLVNNKDKQLFNQSTPPNDLIKLIIEALQNNTSIRLEDIPDDNHSKYPLPNTVGVLCTQVDEKLYLDSLGGVSGNSLAGRFALAVPQVLDHCRHIAQIESAANPDILFFDIGYSHEEDVDDINRRPSIYPYQLNILNYDTSLKSLCLNDIAVSIRHENIILRSLSLNKRLVPRVASAYNYSRSDLSLFRFFMDVQGYQLCTNLMWRPQTIIPGLKYYPRVEFKNIIVAPATWLLESSILNRCAPEQEAENLSTYLEKLDSRQYFKFGNGDQTLFIDKKCNDDIRLLLIQLRKLKSLYLEEAALPEKPNCFDFSDRPMLPQFNLTLQHTEQIYIGISFKNIQDQRLEARQWIPPGKQWLYFELYGEAHRLESILMDKIFPFLKLNETEIAMWFFVRYNEGGDHIRLRIKLTEADQHLSFISKVYHLLEGDQHSGFISDIQIRTYKKEVHRYSTELMEQVEQHFNVDSNYVLSVGPNNLSELQKCRLCMKILQSLRSEEIFTSFEFDSLITKMANAYCQEFEIQNLGFKEINKLYRSLLQEPVPMLSKNTHVLFDAMINSLRILLLQADKHERPKLFADIFHMHVNRLFLSNQRFMELLIYSFSQIESASERQRNIKQDQTVIRA